MFASGGLQQVYHHSSDNLAEVYIHHVARGSAATEATNSLVTNRLVPYSSVSFPLNVFVHSIPLSYKQASMSLLYLCASVSHYLVPKVARIIGLSG